MKRHLALCAVAGLALGRAASAAPIRPDEYTAGFYTRGPDAALYLGQGGIPDPVAAPLGGWRLLPRVTVEANRTDNYFLEEDGRAATLVNLVPGALLIHGRPEHNHLYLDAGLSLPVYESDAVIDRDPTYVLRLGGVVRTGRSSLHGRVGHRRLESENLSTGRRVAGRDTIADVAAERRVSMKSSLGLNASAEDHDFDSEPYVDYRRYYLAGRFYHRLTERSDWFVQGGAGRDETARDWPGLYGDATFYDLSGGLRGLPAPKVSAFGRLGYRWRESDDDAIRRVRAWVANLGAETSPFGLSTFSAELLSDIRPDITGAGDSTVDRRAVLGVKRRLFIERLRGDASALFGRVDYNGTAGTTRDEYWGARLAVDYWSRWGISAGLAYTYTERSSAERADYESGLWTLRTSWNY